MTSREQFLQSSAKIEITDPSKAYSFVVPPLESNIIEIHLYGAGGGGGGNDAWMMGGNGASGQYAKIQLRVNVGDRITIVVGGPGRGGVSNVAGWGGGQGGSSALDLPSGIRSVGGGGGGAAGPAGGSGGGGGGGGATVLLVNGIVVAVVGGGAGGSGSGIRGSGRNATNLPTASSEWAGQNGESRRGDGGGSSGSAGGLNAGLGGKDPDIWDIGGGIGASADVFLNDQMGIVSRSIIYGSGRIPVFNRNPLETMYFSGISSAARGGASGQSGSSGAAVLVFQPLTSYYKDQNNWKQIKEIFVKTSGRWSKVQEIFYKQDGVWKSTGSYNSFFAKASSGKIGFQSRSVNNMLSSQQVIYFQGSQPWVTDANVSDNAIVWSKSALS